jgi:ankyrin repeat protein
MAAPNVFADANLVEGVAYRKLTMVTEALDSGANVNFVSPESGKTPLHIITSMGRPADNAKLVPIVTLLLSRGANLNVQNRDGVTPLMFATLSENAEIMKLLLDAGSDVTIKSPSGKTALDMAREIRFADGVRLLEERQGSAATASPLAAVAEAVQSAVATAVASAPAPARVSNSEQDHALQAAVAADDDEAAQAAILAGANPNLMINGDQETMLIHYAATENRPMVEFLLDHGADVNGRAGPGADEPGWTALNYTRYLDIGEYIEERGGMTARLLDGEPAAAPTTAELFTAIRLGRTGDVADLIRRGVNVNAPEEDTDRTTPIQAAAALDNRFDVLQVLVEAGADPAATDAHGVNALEETTRGSAYNNRRFLTERFPALGPKAIDIPEVKVKFADQQVYDFEENEEVSILSILSKMGNIVFKAKNSYFTIPIDTIRDAIADGSQVRHKCSKELVGAPYAKDVDMKNPYYYVQGNGNFMVPLASLGAAMKKYKILELVETDEVLENVASALIVQSSPGRNMYGDPVNIVSADHCQGGTRQKVFNVKGVLLTTKKEEEGAGRRLTKKRSSRRGGRTVKQKRGTYKRHGRH